MEKFDDENSEAWGTPKLVWFWIWGNKVLLVFVFTVLFPNKFCVVDIFELNNEFVFCVKILFCSFIPCAVFPKIFMVDGFSSFRGDPIGLSCMSSWLFGWLVEVGWFWTVLNKFGVEDKELPKRLRVFGLGCSVWAVCWLDSVEETENILFILFSVVTPAINGLEEFTRLPEVVATPKSEFFFSSSFFSLFGVGLKI